jgi:uncharacterized membrane protein
MVVTPTAVMFYDVILAVHIAAVVIGFGVTFSYPVIGAVAQRYADPRSIAWFHRAQLEIGKRLIMPALAVIVIAGAYLASDRDYWGEFWVWWSLGAAIVLGALGGAFFTPSETRAAELLERDIAAAGAGPVEPSAEYQAIEKKVSLVGALSGLLVLVTVFVMTVKPFS